MSKNASLITEQQKKHRKSSSTTPVKGSQHPLLRMQQNAGNRATQQAANTPTIQAKLSVNPPGDMYEREADQVAAEIVQQERTGESAGANTQGLMRQEIPEEEEEMQMKRSSDSILRQEEQEEEEEMIQPKLSTDSLARQEMPEEEEMLMAKPSPNAVMRQIEEEEEMVMAKSSEDQVPEVDSNLESRIDAAHGGGERLPDNVSSSFESQMGHDLSNVRVHAGAEAHSLSRSLQAEAFTTGNDIFFRSGRYNPGSENGRELLSHEVTHVVQQGAAPALRKEED